MPAHNLESPVHRGFLSEADKAWYMVVRRAASNPGGLMMAEMDTNARWTIRICLVLIEEIRAIEENTATIIDSDNGDFMDDQAYYEQGTGIQFSPSQVEDFLQTFVPVEISSLRTDDTMCSICKEEYGKGKGKSTGLVSDADQRLPGEKHRNTQ